MQRAVTLILSLVVLLNVPALTAAFDCSEVDGDDTMGDAAILLGWSDSEQPLTWAITNALPPAGVTAGEFRTAVEESFAAWEAVETSYVRFSPAGAALGADPDGFVTLTDPQDPDSFSPVRQDSGTDPLSGLTRSGPPDDDGRLNVVTVVNVDWETFFASSSTALAITLYTYYPLSRKIAGADIYLNGFSFDWAVTPTVGRYDVQNVLTHEIGHFIGLGHPDPVTRSESTMYYQAPPMETKKRSLEVDDMNGATYLYPEPGATLVPPDRNTIGLKTIPTTTAAVSGGGGGCTVAPAGSSLGWAAAFAPLLGLSLLLLGRRRLRVAWVTGVVLLLCCVGTARATLVLRLNIMELTLMSSKVAQVTVYDVTPFMEGGRIMRRVRAVVHDPVKGPRDAELEFALPGGVLNGVGMGIAGTPSFAPGEEAVVFLEGARGHVVTGMSQGKFGVIRDAEGATAVQDTRGLCLLDARPPAPGEPGAPATSWAAPLAAPGASFLKAGDSTAPSLPGHAGHIHGGILRVPLPELLDTIRSFTGQ